MIFYGAKLDVARFATALQLRFGKDLQLTTITRVQKSEVYSVSTVINSSWDDVVKELAQIYSLRLTNTSAENIRAISSQRK